MLQFLPECNIALSLATAFLLTYVSIPSIVKVAKTKKLYDVPDERKIHKHAIPTLGGLAIFAGFVLSLTIWCDFSSFPEAQYILASATIVFLIGIKDDILITAPMTKLGGQIIASLLLIIFADLRFTNLHGFFGINEIPMFISIPLTLFVMIVIINGFNLIDGIDGLASGIGILTAGAFGIWFYLNDFYSYSILCTALVGALIAFFRFNISTKENKVFMGDTGALLIGLLISVAVIQFNELNITPGLKFHIQSAPSVSFGILIVPLYDMLQVMLRRLANHSGLFVADKNHIHHKLISLGLSHFKATNLLLGINLLFILFSFWSCHFLTIRRLALVLLVLAIILFNVPIIILRKRKQKNN